MSKNYSARESLIRILRDKNSMKNILLYRGDDELGILRNILKPESAAEKALGIRDISVDSLLSGCKICPDIVEKKPPYGNGANKVMIILNAPRMANRIEINIHRAESVNLLKKWSLQSELN